MFLEIFKNKLFKNCMYYRVLGSFAVPFVLNLSLSYKTDLLEWTRLYIGIGM